jgi:hypothetical protein
MRFVPVLYPAIPRPFRRGRSRPSFLADEARNTPEHALLEAGRVIATALAIALVVNELLFALHIS